MLRDITRLPAGSKRDREKLTVTKETQELTKETQDHRRLAPAKGGARRFVFFGQMLGNAQLLRQ